MPKQRFINCTTTPEPPRDNWTTQQFSETHFLQPLIYVNCCTSVHFSFLHASVTGYCRAHKYMINSNFCKDRHDLEKKLPCISNKLRAVPAYTITTVTTLPLFHCNITSINKHNKHIHVFLATLHSFWKII